MIGRRAYDLVGRVAVVTGGASGIGRGIALALGAEGASVAVLDRDGDGAAATCAMLSDAGAEGLAVPCDTSDPSSIARAKAIVDERFGPAQILVNNAGIIGGGAIGDASLEVWNRLVSINLTGYLLCAQAFGRAMCEQGGGAIVHVASITALETYPMAGGYGATKAGVTMLSRLLAAEWGSAGVRSNVVHPGLIQTPMTQASYADEEAVAARAALVPMRRIGTPEDIAEAVLFLASDRASYVNGSELLVDGGLAPNLPALAA